MVVAETSVPGISTLAAAMPSRVDTGATKWLREWWCLVFRSDTGRCTGFALAAVHQTKQIDAGEQEALASEAFFCGFHRVRAQWRAHSILYQRTCQAIQIEGVAGARAGVSFFRSPVPADASDFMVMGKRRGHDKT